MSDSFKTFIKDPDAILDYKFDWKALTNGTGASDWLVPAETIASHTITADLGITVASSAITDTNTSVTVWLSGGTVGRKHKIACKIVTNVPRTDERTLIIEVAQR